jgi:hypothetical protein
MFQPYNEDTASTEDRIAWVLCQIIDDDAPMRWTRYRFAAECIACNPKLMADLLTLRDRKAKRDHGMNSGDLIAAMMRDGAGA